jgi:hypothetical protein
MHSVTLRYPLVTRDIWPELEGRDLDIDKNRNGLPCSLQK